MIFQNTSGWLFLHIETDRRVDYCSNSQLGVNLCVIVEYGIKNYFLHTVPHKVSILCSLFVKSEKQLILIHGKVLEGSIIFFLAVFVR